MGKKETDFSDSPESVSSKEQLGPYRMKFGIANILHHSEEAGLRPLYTVIIRALGGNETHLGIMGAVGGVSSFFQWFGSLLLRKFNSNRNAMIATLSLSVLFATLTGLAILLALNPDLLRFSLWSYLILILSLALVGGIKANIETNWIGDLVPMTYIGWFTSLKWIVAVAGAIFFMMIFGRLSDIRPKLTTYAFLFLIIAVSQFLAILLIRTITDRIPKHANFISNGSGLQNRLNYRSLPLWAYITYFMLWSTGRSAMSAFATAYLLDQFNYSITQIVGIWIIQGVISILVLIILGNITDKSGHRIPLIMISGVVAASIFLWVASVWWGIIPIIIYTFINGAAGTTHLMLSTNYSLSIFPRNGRSGYLAISRIFIGIASTVSPVAAGMFMNRMKGWTLQIRGGIVNHYHFLFLLCALVSLSSIIPLIWVGNRAVEPGYIRA